MKVIVCEETCLGSGADISVIEADENIGILTQLKHLANEEYKILASDGKEKPQVEINENSAHVYCSGYSIHFDVCEVEKSKVLEDLKEKRANTEAAIKFEIPIYVGNDTSLAYSDLDIKMAVQNQIEQDDPGFDIADEVNQAAIEMELSGDDAADIFIEESIADLMEYIYIDRDHITVDYDETNAVLSDGCIAYDVPCMFDVRRFLNDYKKEIEERATAQELE